jgi:hypothetical protein
VLNDVYLVNEMNFNSFLVHLNSDGRRKLSPPEGFCEATTDKFGVNCLKGTTTYGSDFNIEHKMIEN